MSHCGCMRTRPYLLGVLVCVLLLGSAAGGCSDPENASSVVPPAPYATIDVETAYENLSADPEAQLVDVREPEEWESTGVPLRALLIPLGQIEERAPAELAKDKPVYVICRTGNRSRTASESLVRLGFVEVYNIEGGIRAWLDAGLPVEAYQP